MKKSLMFFALVLFVAALLYVPAYANPADEVIEHTTGPAETAPVITEPVDTSPYTEEPIITVPPSKEPEPTEFTTPVMDYPFSAGSHKERYTDTATEYFLDYYLFIPQNATFNMPLIIFLHGDGEIGCIDALEDYGMIRQARAIYGDSFPFIALSPCTRQYSWTAEPIPTTLMHLIRYVVDTYHIDPDRIIITGHSRGAMGVWYYVSEYGDYFSAAVPVSGHTYEKLDFANHGNVTVWAFSGLGDPAEGTNKVEMTKLVEQLNAAGGNAQYTCYSGWLHSDIVYRVYDEMLFTWMLSQKNSN